jgi:O-antigen/teichoic acid export membrane protein
MIAKQTFFSWAANAINMLVQFAKVPVLYEYLGSFVDKWFLLVALIGYFALFESGLTFTAVRYLGRSLGAEDRDEYSKLYFLLQRWFAIWSVAYLVLSISSGYIYLAFIIDGSSIENLFGPFVIMVLGTAVALAFNYNGAMIMANGYVGVQTLVDAFASLLSFAIMFLLLREGYGFEGVVAAEVIRALLGTLIKWGVVVKMKFRPILYMVYAHQEKQLKVKEIFFSQLKSGYANAGILTFVAIDLWLFGYYFKVEGVANYLNMQTVFGLLAAQVSVITAVALPRLLHEFGRDDNNYSGSFLNNLFFVTSLYGLMAGTLIIFGEQIFTLWLGKNNFIGNEFLFLFAFFYFLEVTIPAWLNLHYAREQMGYAKMFWLAFIIRMASAWLLIGVFDIGFIGVIVSKIIGYGLSMYPYVLVHRNTGLRQPLSFRRIASSYWLGIGMVLLAILFVLLRESFMLLWIDLVLKALFILIACLVSMRVFLQMKNKAE